MNARTALRAATSLLSIGCGVFLCAAAPAMAAEGAVSGYPSMYSYDGGLGVANDVTLSFVGGRFIVKDAGVTSIRIVSESACVRGSAPNIVSCQPDNSAPGGAAAGLTDIWYIKGNDGDDVLRVDSSVPAPYDSLGIVSLAGGVDDDLLVGGQGGSSLSGALGNDTLIGGPGADSLNGGAGDDTLRPGAGADYVTGSDGKDSVSYSGDGRTLGVRAVLDGTTPSGSQPFDGAGDRLAEVEDVAGTPYADLLTGNASANTIRGNGGTDQINGLGGNDTLISTGAPSWLDGGDGDDAFQIKNSVKDILSCGTGTDSAKVDVSDVVAAFGGCETLIG